MVLKFRQRRQKLKSFLRWFQSNGLVEGQRGRRRGIKVEQKPFAKHPNLIVPPAVGARTRGHEDMGIESPSQDTSPSLARQPFLLIRRWSSSVIFFCLCR